MDKIQVKRLAYSNLLTWIQQPSHMPLLLRGARQVGKTYLVETFAKQHFKNYVTVNFEFQPEYAQCFTNLDPKQIVNAISILAQQPIVPGHTLLFFDEIQECPQAIIALRYFKEKMPDLHVIGAGSLLEFTLNDTNFRMPVGRIQFMYIKPLSFYEFLLATNNQQAISLLKTIKLTEEIPIAVHEKLLTLLRDYMILGGMPEVLEHYTQAGDLKYCQYLQSNLLQTYRKDFGKYSTRSDHKHIQTVFSQVPRIVGQQVKYKKIDSEVRSRELKQAIESLTYAGLIIPIYATSGSGLPLSATINTRQFKLNFVDVGLVSRMSGLDIPLLMQEDIMLLNKGGLAEQLVAQELLAYGDSFEEQMIYCWRGKEKSTAEVDFITTLDEDIIPIEVKSGTSKRLKSLQIFIQEKNSSLGVRISKLPLQLEKNILSIPLYMIFELKRLVRDALHLTARK